MDTNIRIKTDYELISDKFYAAIETGNNELAELVLRDHMDTFPAVVKQICREYLLEN